MTDTFDTKFTVLRIPKDTKRFLFDYEHSKFIECNRSMALNVAVKYKNYTQNEALNTRITPCMSYISQKLEKLKKRYWLAGGTLLGEFW